MLIVSFSLLWGSINPKRLWCQTLIGDEIVVYLLNKSGYWWHANHHDTGYWHRNSCSFGYMPLFVCVDDIHSTEFFIRYIRSSVIWCGLSAWNVSKVYVSEVFKSTSALKPFGLQLAIFSNVLRNRQSSN